MHARTAKQTHTRTINVLLSFSSNMPKREGTNLREREVEIYSK